MGIGVRRYGGAKPEGGIGIRGKASTGIGLGILCWIATQAVAFGLAGAGHGWMGPLLLSMPLLMLYPFAFVRLFGAPVGVRRGDAVMLGLVVALDLFLSYDVLIQEPGYLALTIDVAPGLVGVWFVLWILWQVAAIVTARRNAARRPLQGAAAR